MSVLKDDPELGPLLSLSGEGSLEAKYSVSIDVCGNARCGCFSTRFVVQALPPQGEAGASKAGIFWLDAKTREVQEIEEVEGKPELRRLAQAVQAVLTEEDWTNLYQWYCLSKLRLIHTTAVETISTSDLPEAGDGRMVAFTEVFPLGVSLYFDLEGQKWAVDEQYCVNPKCSCTKTVLTFVSMPAPGASTASSQTAVWYDYRSARFESADLPPANCPSHTALMGALRGATPKLNVELALRHNLMQALYATRRVQETEKMIASLASRLRVGRNEPCPCGSGRKYKHCCLNK